MSLRLDECLCTTLCLVCDLDSTVSLVRRVDRNALWCNTLDFRLVLVVIFPIQDRWSHSSRLSLVASHPHRPRLLVASPRPNRLSLASSSSFFFFFFFFFFRWCHFRASTTDTPTLAVVLQSSSSLCTGASSFSSKSSTRRRPNRRRTLNVHRRLPNNNNNNNTPRPSSRVASRRSSSSSSSSSTKVRLEKRLANARNAFVVSKREKTKNFFENFPPKNEKKGLGFRRNI